MMQFINSVLTAFSIYSRIPAMRMDKSGKNSCYAACCLPFAGAVIGAAVFFVSNVLSLLHFWRGFDTVILVLLPVLLTGGIHLRGFWNTMDALCSFQSEERLIELQSGVHAGAAAIISAAVYVLLDGWVWMQMTPKLLPLAAMSFIFSRILSGYAQTAWKSMKENAAAAESKEAADRKKIRRILLLQAAVTVSVMFCIHWQAAFSAVFTALILFGYYRAAAYKKFGGVSGDLAGWYVQVCELGMMGSLVIGREMWY